MTNPHILTVNIITSNPDKFADCQLAFRQLNTPDKLFQVKQIKPSIDIQEIQSMDPLAVAKHKMESYINLTPIQDQSRTDIAIMEDSSLELAELGGFPGPYIKDFYKAIGGSAGLAKRYAGTRAIIKSGIVIYRLGHPIGEFTCEIPGTISSEPRGTGSYGYADVFIPDDTNDETLAEMDSETRIRYQPDTVGYCRVIRIFAEYHDKYGKTKP